MTSTERRRRARMLSIRDARNRRRRRTLALFMPTPGITTPVMIMAGCWLAQAHSQVLHVEAGVTPETTFATREEQIA